MARLIAIDRHRIATDGKGVTTLVGFHGCPLNCLYCLNKQCKDNAEHFPDYTVEQLIEEVAIDNLYFQATGGGVTFGGGEPLLYPEFIAEFRRKCPQEWKINIETSLNAGRRAVETLAKLADELLIDAKDLNADIYQSYTGRSNKAVMENLQWIADNNLQKKCIVRLPLITGFNSKHNVIRSRIYLAAIGFRRFNEFKYVRK